MSNNYSNTCTTVSASRFQLHIACVASLILFAATANSKAQQASQDDPYKELLTTKRVYEGRYGISIRPPLDATLRRRTVDDSWVQILKDNEYSISIAIKQSKRELKIDQVVRTAINQFGFKYPDAVELDNRIVKPASRPGWLIYFGVNLPAKFKPNAGVDKASLLRVARAQIETAHQLRQKGRDIHAYRLYAIIANNSPDKVIRVKASQWLKAYQADRGFMARYLQDEAMRRKVNKRDAENKPWVMGQAFMQISPLAFLEIRIECDHATFEKTRAILDAMLRTLEIDDPFEMDKKRKELIKRGDLFQKTIDHKKLVTALLPEVEVPIVDADGKPIGKAPLRLQYYRITQNGKDMGWMKVVHRERRDNIVTLKSQLNRISRKVTREVVVDEKGVLGIGVDVYARFHTESRIPNTNKIQTSAIDTVSRCFLSKKGTYESWATQTSVRQRVDFKNAKPKPKPSTKPNASEKPSSSSRVARSTTWLETGVRNHSQITIIREGPSGVKRFLWTKPKEGYVGQVELYLLAPLLPKKSSEQIGFYAYYPNTGTISFRSVRIEPNPQSGQFNVYSRPSPDSPEQMSQYTPEGLLIKRTLGEGRLVVPTTRKELAAIWKIDLKDQLPGNIDLKNPQKGPLPPSDNRVPR